VLNTINQTKIKPGDNSITNTKLLRHLFLCINIYYKQNVCYFHWTLYTSFENPWGK
jgi:hypothetical protein